MTGPEHYAEAERLLNHAGSMLETDVHPADHAELSPARASSSPWPPRTRRSRVLRWQGSARTWTQSTRRRGEGCRDPSGRSARCRLVVHRLVPQR